MDPHDIGDRIDPRRERLVAAGAEALADALLELSYRNRAARESVERLASAPASNIMRFFDRIEEIGERKMRGRHVEPEDLVEELAELLEDVRVGVEDPRRGVELLVMLYRTDARVIEGCGDLEHEASSIFKSDALELFVRYARRCEDSAWVIGQVMDLVRTDEYGMRQALLRHANSFLAEPDLHLLVARLEEEAASQREPHRARFWMDFVATIASRLRDVALFLRARLTYDGDLSEEDHLALARMHLALDDPEAASGWLRRLPETARNRPEEIDEMLLDIHARLGNHAEREAAAWRIYERHRTGDALRKLLEIVGADRQEEIESREVARIVGDPKLTSRNALLLIALGRADLAEEHVLGRLSQVDGDSYGEYEPLAEKFDQAGRALSASLLYRALLDSILLRARSSAYHHGAEYFRRLSRLDRAILDWRGHEPHAAWRVRMQWLHGKKRAFWSRLDGVL